MMYVSIFFFFLLQSLPQTPKTAKNCSVDVDGGSSNSSSLETVDDSGSEADNSLVFQVINSPFLPVFNSLIN